MTFSDVYALGFIATWASVSLYDVARQIKRKLKKGLSK